MEHARLVEVDAATGLEDGIVKGPRRRIHQGVVPLGRNEQPVLLIGDSRGDAAHARCHQRYTEGLGLE